MLQTFYKYQGTGNDFVLIDNRSLNFNKNNTKLIAHLCDRRFGIGADGLILLEKSATTDFKMIYYNSDGNESTMCGNGGRCIVAFAQFLNIFEAKTTFEAIDGLHHAEVKDETIALQMINVDSVKVANDYTFLDTGSPHHVEIVEDLLNYDVFKNGKAIRNSELYINSNGSNVNFVEQINDRTFALRTYERGVEDETLSCGTGATAVAISMFEKGLTKANSIHLNVQGGNLIVTFEKQDSSYINVFLEGPAKQVFKGEVKC